MKAEYILADERGQKRTIEAAQVEPLFRSMLLPILLEMGLPPDAIAGREISRLVSGIISHIREREGALAVARVEFRKVKQQRERDYETTLQFMRSFSLDEVPEPVSAEKLRRVA